MLIEKVHGLQTTALSLNDRFTMLATAAPGPVAMRPRRRPNMGYFNQNLNFKNRNLIEQIALRLEMQAKRQAVKQRLGMLRRFGSESSLPGLRRSNSFGNLSQTSFKNRYNWRQSNGNLSRAASFGNLSTGTWRGLWRRGGGARAVRGRFRGGRQNVGRINRTPQRGHRGRTRARGRARSQSSGAARGQGMGQARGPGVGQARGQARGQNRGQARGQGRGQAPRRGRSQSQKPVPSKEELDLQLEQYMAGSRAALDQDLDDYMNHAMDME
ncbi:unnamed protein product [Diatraea saccharalis]|uniref:Chromatin target of PRMT1 protein C-terminal domain-containing protein n=1 Tax=Diatraea saccharalis TaxID=40085 RepID=A0A9N9RBH1_9NEOP|nr:unnamed protein product [Diatraea saccharalis]